MKKPPPIKNMEMIFFMNNRFELYVSADEDLVAIMDKMTGEKYSTLEEIIDLLNNIIGKDYYYNRIIKMIDDYDKRISANKGIVITGDIYNAKMSILQELLEK
jgi:hypothetical protein